MTDTRPSLKACYFPPAGYYAVVVYCTMLIVNGQRQSLSELVYNVSMGSWKAFCDSQFGSDNVYKLYVYDGDGKMIDQYQ